MTIDTLLLYVAIAAGLIIIPGPNILLIIANTLKHGVSAGLITVAGTSTAMVIQLAIVSLGIGSILAIVSDWYHWLRWAGALYLIYLGLKALLSNNRESVITSTLKPHHVFAQGFLVSITNPKTLLFFSAFLPQFVSPTSAAMPQLLILSATFLSLAMFFDSSYALLSSRFYQSAATTKHGLVNKLTGLILLSAGILCATNSLQNNK